MVQIDRRIVSSFVLPSAGRASAAPTATEAKLISSEEATAAMRLASIFGALSKRGLDVEVDRKLPRTVLHLSGRLDQQSAPLLKDAIREFVALTPTDIDVNLASVQRVDGVGLAALVWAWGNAREHGRELRLIQVRPDVLAIVERLNLHQLLCVVV